MRRILNILTSELGRIILGLCFFIPAFIFEKTGSEWVALSLYIISVLISGTPVFVGAVKGLLRRDLLDEKFLMSIASIGAFFVGTGSEGAAVMLFALVGEYFEHKAVEKSRKSIKSLMDIQPDEATIIENGIERVVDAEDVAVGDTVIIKTGERVAVDCVVSKGSAEIDSSALTGESLPVSVEIGTEIGAGVVVINGVIEATVVRPASESSAQRILDLVENANERKSKTENFITKFSHYYTPSVVAIAILLVILFPLFKICSISDAIYRALIFLVISCPCALVISVPMAFFGGIGGAASSGILYKGGMTFSKLAKADTFAFDKTGTLTQGKFTVDEIYTYEFDKEKFLELVGACEKKSNHPMALAISSYADSHIELDSISEIGGKGISAMYNGDEIIVGNLKFLMEKNIFVPDEFRNLGIVFAAYKNKFIGCIKISDRIKDEAKEAISSLKKIGIKNTVMLSGDKSEIAEKVGRELGISKVKAELLPEEKFSELEKLIQASKATVYVGDGINDAPALALSDIGIAMGNIGSDSAIESSDVVIMSGNLKKLPVAVKIARKTIRIATENIIFALGVKIAVMILGAFNIANMWLAVFADVGVAMISILNSMRTLIIRKGD